MTPFPLHSQVAKFTLYFEIGHRQGGFPDVRSPHNPSPSSHSTPPTVAFWGHRAMFAPATPFPTKSYHYLFLRLEKSFPPTISRPPSTGLPPDSIPFTLSKSPCRCSFGKPPVKRQKTPARPYPPTPQVLHRKMPPEHPLCRPSSRVSCLVE